MPSARTIVLVEPFPHRTEVFTTTLLHPAPHGATAPDPSDAAPTGVGAANAARTRYVVARGVQFAYRTFGVPGDVPLVLLPRYRGTMDSWDPAFLDVLAVERRVIIFDNAGVSRSSGEAATTIGGMARDAATFLGALGVARADVLGWSMGGAVAQRLTLDHPELVRRLIVAGSGPGGIPGAPPMPERVREVASKPVNDDEDFLYLFFDGDEARRAAGRAHLRRLGHRDEPPGPPAKPETVRAMSAAIVDWRSGGAGIYDRLGEIRQPVLVANGAHDVMIDADDSYAMVRRLPDAELVLYSDAGHGFLFQHAERFARRVLAFLA